MADDYIERCTLESEVSELAHLRVQPFSATSEENIETPT